ncbi:MAG: hypothetical protein QGG40_10935 [Myxococcota bacterium]|nr:hypothetical protein [Myxococcota bacterium]
MVRITTSLFFALLLSTVALAAPCDMDDCTLARHLHQVEDTPGVSGANARTPDKWSWMNHDLAMAREAARAGHRARAIRIATSVDHAMRAQIEPMVSGRGDQAVRDLHNALQAVIDRSQGSPLAELPHTTTCDRDTDPHTNGSCGGAPSEHAEAVVPDPLRG